MKNTLERFREAISYPDPVPNGVSVFSMRVDGEDIQARLLDKRLVLSRVLSRDEKDLPTLAAYAAGRILKEDAVLAWDENQSACILWQDIKDNATDEQLTAFFEAFMNSCDWWVARAKELNAPPAVFPDVLIRP